MGSTPFFLQEKNSHLQALTLALRSVTLEVFFAMPYMRQNHVAQQQYESNTISEFGIGNIAFGTSTLLYNSL